MTDIDFTEDTGRAPLFKAPSKTCDTHSHIYGALEQYPRTVENKRMATVDAYKAMLKRLGIERCVIVHSSMYGTDNSITLDAIELLGQKFARGTAVVSPEIEHAEIRRLHVKGIRGVRVSSSNNDITLDQVKGIAKKIAPFGWVLQLQDKNPNFILDYGKMLSRLPCPIIFDHFGRTDPKEGDAGANFCELLRLLQVCENIWVRLSALYLNSLSGPPFYEDLKARAKKLTKTRPDRLLFALNWPHPKFPFPGVPESADCIDPIFDWIKDSETRQLVLSTNAGVLYGFDS